MTTASSLESITAPTPASSLRSVEMVVPPPRVHMVGDGFRVHGYFSVIPDAMERLSPFIMLDYNPPHAFSPSKTPRGVGVHPHRGFETVTLAFQGAVEHHDSSGGGGIIQSGDVQWMTAAGGILHKEFHETEFSRKGGVFQMVQLWVNLPAKHKMDKPRYQGLLASQMGIEKTDDGNGTVRVIAGAYRGATGPAQTFSPMNVYDVTLPAGGRFSAPLPRHFNTALLVMKGTITVGGERVPENRFVVMNNDGDGLELSASSDAQVLVLSGEPIDEPIAAYGPFVMNTRQQLVEAVDDFNAGKFGHLE